MLLELADRRLSLLAAREIQQLYSLMMERGRSPRTIRYTHSVLSSALEQAVKWGVFSRNPAKAVDLPRASRREMTCLTPDQAVTFLEASVRDRWAPLWHLLLITGMRPGEAMALRWQDLAEGNIRIQRNLVRHPDGRWYLQDPKTPRAPCRYPS